MLIRSVRLVPVGRGAAPTWGGEPVDLRLADGRLTVTGNRRTAEGGEAIPERQLVRVGS